MTTKFNNVNFDTLERASENNENIESMIDKKLKEMDNVIKKIHSQFQQSDNAIIICGDHGNLSLDTIYCMKL